MHLVNINKKIKKRVFNVFDTETTKRDGWVFDLAWKTVDRKGNVYGTGSYFAKDVVEVELPYYLDKIASYVGDAYEHTIKPVPFYEMRKEWNTHIGELVRDDLIPTACAYNLKFDMTRLRETAKMMGFDSFADRKVDFMCIWRLWCESAPKIYGRVCPYSDKGNPKTDCESVARFEFQNPTYDHRHTAMSDVDTEVKVLLKALARKKKMPLNDLSKQPWKIAKERVYLKEVA